MKRKPQPRHVLTDHQRVGKRLIPPLLQLGNIEDSQWLDRILPELLWLALLNRHVGLTRAAALAISLSRCASRHSPSPKWFAPASAYAELEPAQQQAIACELRDTGQLLPIADSIASLSSLYPQFPLGFLCASPAQPVDASLRHAFKELVTDVMDRRSVAATFVQAGAVYLAFDGGMLKAFEGTALARFPEIEKFPHTETSKEVACAVRATISMMMGQQYQTPSTWATYFWNQGLQIERCDYERLVR